MNAIRVSLVLAVSAAFASLLVCHRQTDGMSSRQSALGLEERSADSMDDSLGYLGGSGDLSPTPRVSLDEPVDTTEVESRPPDVSDCVSLDDLDEVLECLDGNFDLLGDVPSIVAHISDSACSQDLKRRRRVEIVAHAIEFVGVGQFTLFARQLADSCSTNWGRTTVVAAVELIASRDRELYYELRGQLGVDSLFGPQGHEILVSVAGALARSENDLDLLGIIEEGSLGRLGGSGKAFTQAVIQMLDYRKSSPEEFYRIAREILSSPTRLVEEGVQEGVGNHLIAHILMNRNLSVADQHETVGLIMDIFDDPAWGLGAARQLVAYNSRDQPPYGIDVVTWGQVWDHAKVLSDG